eukprot:TRINITY_DN3095_c0_g1_i2.p1 TRINITY_DN3095_c0_g1~~TRINITY_DN3095_c0_g1_i2.p1  ORF type:complete len:492 (+),score=100.95 TRINITY_DN3095_c0_g1_i2:271-1746(+)
MGGSRQGVVFASRHAALLRCPLCFNVFVNPVITSCGHTWCAGCIAEFCSGNNTHCPLDNQSIDGSRYTTNKLVAAQVSQLLVHCKNGLKWSQAQKAFVVDPSGCQATVPLSAKADHEAVCPFQGRAESSANNTEGSGEGEQDTIEGEDTARGDGDSGDGQEDPSVVRACIHSAFGCEFAGDQGRLLAHLANDCGYERLKIAQDMMMTLYRTEVQEKEDELTALQAQISGDSEEDQRTALHRLRDSFKRIEDKIDSRIDAVIMTERVQAAGLYMYKTRHRVARSQAVGRIKKAFANFGKKTKEIGQDFTQVFDDAFKKMSKRQEPIYMDMSSNEGVVEAPNTTTATTTTTTTTSTTDGTQGTSVTVPSRPLIGVPQEMASDHSEHNPRGIASPPCTVLPTTPTAAQVRMASYERSSSDTGVEEPQEQRELSPVDTEVTADVLVEGGNDWEFLEAEDEGVTVAVEGTVAPAVAEDTNIPTGPAATDAANAQQE